MAQAVFSTTVISRRQAVALLVFAAVLWSLGGLFIKSVHWNGPAIAGARSAIAGILIAAVVRRPHFHWSGSQVGAAFAYAATVILFVLANRLTTAVNAILLQYTAPVYVALLSHWFLRERIRWIDWATIAMAFGGMGLFFFDSLSPAGLWGNAAAIGSGISFAWLVLLLRKQKAGSTIESVLLGNILTAVLCAPFYFSHFPTGLSDWSALVILGVLQLGLSYLFYSVAIKFVTAIEAILIPIVEPILNPVLVLLFLGERPGAWALVGGAVVLGAVTFRSLGLSIHDRAQLRNPPPIQ